MIETVRLTTAQALVKFLDQQYLSVDGKEHRYVEGIFSIFGHGNVLSVGQALEDPTLSLKHYSGKNEQGMAHAGIAFARENLGQKIFAITTSAGPGSANLVTAAATAFANHTPILLLPADTFASRQPDPVLQQLEHAQSYMLTTNDAFKAVSRYWDRIVRPEQLMSALLRAFEVMTNPITMGPVTLCLPQDTAGEAFDYPVSFFVKRVHYLQRSVADNQQIKVAADWIRSSRYPVILVGGGAKYSQARDILMQLALRHEIPLVETHAGKSTVEAGFIYNLGGSGILGTSAANQAVQKADIIIAVGTRYTDFTTASKTLFNWEECRFININVSREQAYKWDGWQVVSDAKAALEAMAPLLGDYRSNFGLLLGQWRQQWEEERSRLEGISFNHVDFVPEIDGQWSLSQLKEYSVALDTHLSQSAVVIALNNLLPSDSIIIGSAGSLPGDMQRLWNPKEPNTYHLEYGYSCMGYEIAGALGAKLAHPEKDVFALVGDGSFLMLHSELVTALQYQKKIHVLLFDNAGYGCINNLQMEHGGESLGTEFRDSQHQVMNIDYATIARAYGALSFKVNTLAQLKDALLAAKQSPLSTLIEIKVLPKTMSDGYSGSWWNVGLSEVSPKPSNEEAYQQRRQKLKRARKY